MVSEEGDKPMDTTRETTRAKRLHIGFFGRCNAGKSTLCNALSGQNVALVSEIPGTTTDPVEKVLEMLPIGPVVLHDTAGLDDESVLGALRVEKSLAVLKGVDVALLILTDTAWGEHEERLVRLLAKAAIPFAIVCNCRSKEAFATAQTFRPQNVNAPVTALWRPDGQWVGLDALRSQLVQLAPDSEEPPMLQDLLPAGKAARIILLCPQDSGAPKGRLIMPQVQAIRDALDARALCLVCTEDEYADALEAFAGKVDLVVCDSQIIHKAAPLTPKHVPLTTFSILMARLKGDLSLLVQGAAALTQLAPGDTVIIQEACSHHAQKDDIGRVKIPRLLSRMAGGPVHCPMLAGRHWSGYEGKARAIVHCGGCALTRKEMNARLKEALALGIPMTNYGIAISLAQGVLTKALAPFPEALALWQKLTADPGT